MTDRTATLVVLSFVVGVVALIVALGIFFWYAAALSRVFARRDVEPWRAWVPVLNEAEILRLGGRPAWTVVFFFIPVVCVYAVVLRALAANRIGRTFGRGGGATALAIVLPPVWATVLASTRDPAAAEAPAPARAARPAHAASAPVTTVPPAATPSTSVASSIAEPPVAEPPIAEPPVAEPPVVGLPVAEPPVVGLPVAEPPAVVVQAPPVVAPDGPSTALPPIRTPFMDHPPEEPTPVASNADVPAAERPARERPAVEPSAVELPLDDEAAETIVVERPAAVSWSLVTDDGGRYPLERDVVVLGRRPAGEEPGVQYLAVPDTTRTLSKQHACLTRDADGDRDRWTVTDLASTNGVFLDLDGVERRVAPGESAAVTGRLLLGTVGLRIEREGAR